MAGKNFARRPVLLLGSSGLLGCALALGLERRGESFLAPSREKLDLARPDAVGGILEALTPRRVINAAAFSDVSRAELPEHRDEVFLVNRDGAEAVARACAARSIPLVYISTDYVFDGAKGRPYLEDDRTRPLQVYGESKLEGEQKVLEAYPAALVVRTSTLFGPGKPGRLNYVDAIARQARGKTLLEVVETPVSSPTYTPDLAEGTLNLLERGATGVVHTVNAGSCSRLELARAVVESAGLAGSVEVRARPEPPGALRRPAYSVLDASRHASLTGSPLRSWHDALAAYLAPNDRG